MHLRCSRIFGLFVAIIALGFLSGCIGKGTSGKGGSGVQTVTLSPASSVSLDLGGTQTFSASARDSSGRTVFGTINFLASCTDQQPCATITIANNGQACAGSWDSLTNPVVCTPGVAGFAPGEGRVVVTNSWPGKRHATDYQLGANWFTDKADLSLYDGKIQGGKTILKWRSDILSDWAKRWSWLAK